VSLSRRSALPFLFRKKSAGAIDGGEDREHLNRPLSYIGGLRNGFTGQSGNSVDTNVELGLPEADLYRGKSTGPTSMKREGKVTKMSQENVFRSDVDLGVFFMAWRPTGVEQSTLSVP
jgi:hypothetical protein